jgi:hypothetical protein
MSYGQVVSEFRHYDYTEKSNIAITPTNAILKLLNEQQNISPPSYSAVLAEKKQQWLSNYDKSVGCFFLFHFCVAYILVYY